MISNSLLDAILNYLTTKPYKEVHGFLQAVQQEIADERRPAAGGKRTTHPSVQLEEKGDK
jgi:hypothetical protein